MATGSWSTLEDTLRVNCRPQDFFSKFLMGGPQNFSSLLRTDGDEVNGGGGETCEQNLTETETAHLMQNLAVLLF